jgi:hypothetical protein
MLWLFHSRCQWHRQSPQGTAGGLASLSLRDKRSQPGGGGGAHAVTRNTTQQATMSCTSDKACEHVPHYLALARAVG